MSQQASMFFFEKKNQKTFVRLHPQTKSTPTPSLRAKRSNPALMTPPPFTATQPTGSLILTPSLSAPNGKSLFASFSPEKEESFL
jgi:hypothetical protein